MMRANDRVLRAAFSTLMLLCLLAVGGRPAEPRRMLEEQACKIVPAHAHVLSPIVRRSGPIHPGDGHVRPQLALPATVTTPVPPRAAILVEAQLAPALRFALFVHSGSARGPPQA